MKVFTYKNLNAEEIKALCKRTAVDFDRIEPTVREIIQAVKTQGDVALQSYTQKFDGFLPDPLVIPVPAAEDVPLSEDKKAAFDRAFANIYAFHMAQKPGDLVVETMPGVVCRREARAVEAVGLYVPGGTAVLPSTVLMLGVPAMIAGCPTRIMATPPQQDGAIAPEILYCAALTGITHILKAGGAQAVAALAYGTESVPKVHKIFGPGNQYVTCAKMLVSQSDAVVAIDMPAGPSEVLVIADETANPEFVAADLLSQAEHGADSQVVLVAQSAGFIEETLTETERQLQSLPRMEAARKALANSSAVLVEDRAQALVFSNLWAPEHLIIASENAAEYVPGIINAGSVFLGNWTPESAGDYASGTNHTLPTSGYAAMYSGVSLDSFYKMVTFQELTPDGLRELGPTVEVMAQAEGLEAHRQAVSRRLRHLS
ncbi:histidinol dehydrogenase [Cyclonatronum proteinivorum]|uniref:Histidinol dehydrogenase n=1 Tax=Cyclonatronum proteinivorum TaxID=1457365 RepID=A0A345UMB2_9BACT|nr:histidinol dehydrogenase [Cyclonatronum proteinivorum]AXJ01614.1 histidinol dehydrogenase [Cyclonatronum proteinivorum]